MPLLVLEPVPIHAPTPGYAPINSMLVARLGKGCGIIAGLGLRSRTVYLGAYREQPL